MGVKAVDRLLIDRSVNYFSSRCYSTYHCTVAPRHAPKSQPRNQSRINRTTYIAEPRHQARRRLFFSVHPRPLCMLFRAILSSCDKSHPSYRLKILHALSMFQSFPSPSLSKEKTAQLYRKQKPARKNSNSATTGKKKAHARGN